MNKAPPRQLNPLPEAKTKPSLWFRQDKDLHRHVFAALDQIKSNQSNQWSDNAKLLALYEDAINVPGVINAASLSNTLAFNVVRSVIDTAASKIAANKPMPEFNTQDGDYRLQRKASLLTQFNNGIFDDNKTYSLMQDCFIDAALWGTGVIQVFASESTIKHERVRIDEIYVDSYEGQYRKPRNLFQERKVYRDLLLQRAFDEQWDKKAIEAIEKAPTYDDMSTGMSEMIRVVEAWHLPMRGKKGEMIGGRYCVVIENHTLQDEEYTLPIFPFAFFRWSNARIGFYGQGIAAQLAKIQDKINKTLRHIDRHMAQSGLKIILPYNSQINPQHLVNTNIPIIEADLEQGTPAGLTFPAVNPETYKYLQMLIDEAYQLSGVSQAIASARKERGTPSNAALQTLSDQQTERFMLPSQQYEQFSLDIADLTAQLGEQLFTSGSYSPESNQNSDLIKKIKFKKGEVQGATYKLKCFPVSAFTQSPAARLQQVQDWMQAGAMPPKRAIQLMGDNPDYRDWQSQETASLARVQQYLDLMKHDGVYNSPDEYLDLPEALGMVQAEINRSITQDVPDDHIDLMRQFMAECQALQGPQVAPGMAIGPEVDPLAVPAAPPVSDLMPMAGPA